MPKTLLALLLVVPFLQIAPKAGDVDAAAKSFLQAFVGADVQGMKAHFADTVRFDGEVRFVIPGADRTVTRDQLADAYARLFEGIGRENWTALIKKAQPTLSRAAKDGELLEFVRAGDFVYDLHLREALKGERDGLNDAVVFVLRVVDGKPLIVGHFADY